MKFQKKVNFNREILFFLIYIELVKKNYFNKIMQWEKNILILQIKVTFGELWKSFFFVENVKFKEFM